MNNKISKYIVWANMAIVAVIYICAASIPSFGSSIGGFFLTILHVGLNFMAAVVLSIIHVATKRSHPMLGQIRKGLWLSVGLVTLVSFPTCLVVGQIHPARF